MRDRTGQKKGMGGKGEGEDKREKNTFISLWNCYWIIGLVPQMDFLILCGNPTH